MVACYNVDHVGVQTNPVWLKLFSYVNCFSFVLVNVHGYFSREWKLCESEEKKCKPYENQSYAVPRSCNELNNLCLFFLSSPSLPSAVFTWTNLLVVVVELDAEESEALDVVPLVTSSVLNEQQLIVGVVVVVDPGVVPINSRGEKQRMHLRDGFLGDQLDPIYVAYNM